MRINSILANNTEPVKKFEVTNLSDIVVIAGANGVGKTRLINNILSHLQNPTSVNVKFEIVATSEQEVVAWGKRTLDTKNEADCVKFAQTLQQNRKRKFFKSSVLYYESDRTIKSVKPFAFTWDVPDPYEENVGWNLTFGGLSGRFQDTQHAIFKKIYSQRNGIASRAQSLMKQGKTTMNLDFADPLEPFRDAFAKLLGPKTLAEADIGQQILRYLDNGHVRDIQTLSSGESEVVKIAFDFILREPSDCIVFFDEPELHLHPELSYRLINTLKGIGTNNQFVLCTHSPDVISSSLDDSVVFVGPAKGDGRNQAIVIGRDDKTNDALKQLGHSVGVISLGKRIVLIEGKDSSLDKKTYGSILKNKYPEMVLVPCEGKQALISFDSLMTNILNNSIWGVDFFMLCDRDANSFSLAEGQAGSQRLRFLSKYHLENYFLDEEIIARALGPYEDADSWLRDKAKIRACLLELARELASYATALNVSKFFRTSVGNVDIMPKGAHGKLCDELSRVHQQKAEEENRRVEAALDAKRIDAITRETFERFAKSFEKDDDYWKDNIPGKQLVSKFCAKSKIQEGRFKNMYLRSALDTDGKCFADILETFNLFSKM